MFNVQYSIYRITHFAFFILRWYWMVIVKVWTGIIKLDKDIICPVFIPIFRSRWCWIVVSWHLNVHVPYCKHTVKSMEFDSLFIIELSSDERHFLEAGKFISLICCSLIANFLLVHCTSTCMPCFAYYLIISYAVMSRLASTKKRRTHRSRFLLAYG